MRAFFNKFRSGLLPMYVLLAILINSVTSCGKDELEIQNDFPFEVKVMPVPKEIAKDKYLGDQANDTANR